MSILEVLTMKKIKDLLEENKRILIPVISGVLLLLFLIIIFFTLNRESKEIQKGTAYLKELEKKDFDQVEEKVKKAKVQTRSEAIESGKLSIWAQFDDYVIFGDSRTVGFSFHEFLDSKRVIADGGYTIADIATYEEQIVSLNPSTLFLCTGLNDVSIGYWETPEAYVEAYEEVIQELMEKLPDTEIYINSILPAQDPAFEQSSKWREIPDYNVAVQAWCQEKGYHYIDNTEVYNSHSDLYDVDGIHFKKEFYEYWAANMLAEVEI